MISNSPPTGGLDRGQIRRALPDIIQELGEKFRTQLHSQVVHHSAGRQTHLLVKPSGRDYPEASNVASTLRPRKPRTGECRRGLGSLDARRIYRGCRRRHSVRLPMHYGDTDSDGRRDNQRVDID